jgi:hypothetical protein
MDKTQEIITKVLKREIGLEAVEAYQATLTGEDLEHFKRAMGIVMFFIKQHAELVEVKHE